MMEKKFDDMSKKERLEYLFSLLPDAYIINATDIDGRESLRRMVYYATGNGKTVEERLKDIGFYLNRYPELEQFLFILTYFDLVKTQREVLEKKRVDKGTMYSNQKLISNIKKIEVDTDIDKLKTFFLVISDTYKELKLEDNFRSMKNRDNEFELIEKFNENLIFQHRDFESTQKLDIKKSDKHINLLDEEVNELSKRGDIYDNAYLNYFSGEKELLNKNLKKICDCKSIKNSLMGMSFIMEGGYIGCLNSTNFIEQEQKFFILVNSILFLSKMYEIHLLKGLVHDTETMKMIEKHYDYYYNRILEEVSMFEQNTRSDIFEAFAFHIDCLYEKNRYHYIQKMSNDINLNLENLKFERCKLDKVCFSEEVIESYTTKELIEYFIPDKEQRKPSDRNVIKDRLKYILVFLKYISEQGTFIAESGYGIELKIAYLILYGRNIGKTKINSTLPKKLYDGTVKKIKKSDMLLWNEIYFYMFFLLKDCSDVYNLFRDKRNQFLNKCENLIERMMLKSD